MVYEPRLILILNIVILIVCNNDVYLKLFNLFETIYLVLLYVAKDRHTQC